MEKMQFIKTSDVETYKKLVSEGFICIDRHNSVYTFLNDRPMTFDEKKITYSNKLEF